MLQWKTFYKICMLVVNAQSSQMLHFAVNYGNCLHDSSVSIKN